MALKIDLLDSTPILKHTYDIFPQSIWYICFKFYSILHVLPNLSSNHTNMKFTNQQANCFQIDVQQQKRSKVITKTN